MANINELRNTVSLMLSDDWKERFVAEYRQLKSRIDSLKLLLNNWEKGQLNFTPSSPKIVHEIQLSRMEDYLAVLDQRARQEGIDLNI